MGMACHRYLAESIGCHRNGQPVSGIVVNPKSWGMLHKEDKSKETGPMNVVLLVSLQLVRFCLRNIRFLAMYFTNKFHRESWCHMNYWCIIRGTVGTHESQKKRKQAEMEWRGSKRESSQGRQQGSKERKGKKRRGSKKSRLKDTSSSILQELPSLWGNCHATNVGTDRSWSIVFA